MATKTALLSEREWRRCRGKSERDFDAFIHFAQHHVKIQHPEKGAIPFKMRQAQLEIIEVWMTERYSIVLKARQIGWSTLAAVYCLWLAMFYADRVIVMLSRNEREAMKLLNKADYAWKRLPSWMRRRAPNRTTDNKTDITFDNGSKIESLPSKEDPARGSAVTLVVVDEWAFFDNAAEAWASIQPVADVGGRVIGLSTANGSGDFFHTFWVRARTGVSKFVPMFYPWWANSDRGEEWYDAQRADMQEWQLHQEYPSTEEEAFIKSGRPVFDVDALAEMPVREPRRGVLSTVDGLRFIEQKGGEYEVWELPVPGKSYAIGGDVAEGLEHGDFSSLHVIRADTLKVVAEWHGHTDPDLFGEQQANLLGRFYNQALNGIEVNNHGLTTNKALQRKHYPRLYYRRILDQNTLKRRVQVGWRTDVGSKPLMIDELARAIRNGLEIPCKYTIEELKTFVRDEKGRMSGSPFDDRVISLAIAVQMLNHVADPQYEQPDINAWNQLDYLVEQDMLREAASARSTEPIGAHNVRR